MCPIRLAEGRSAGARRYSPRYLLLGLVAGSILWAVWLATEQPTPVAEAVTFVPPPTGLVGWWPGDGDATDIQTGNDGALQGGTFFTTAKVGEGFSFDSNDDRISIPHVSDFDIQSPGFTVLFWLKGVKNQPHALYDVVDKSHGFVDSKGWTFQGNSAAGSLSFFVGGGGGRAGNFDGASSGDVLDGSFHHFAGTWDGSSIRAYVDGTTVDIVSFTAPVNNTRSLNLAYSWGGGSPRRFFQRLG